MRGMADGKVDLKLEDVTLNMISIFELQAKAARLMVPSKLVVEAVKAIVGAFNVEPFHRREIIEVAYRVKKLIPDYVDCLMVATAAVLKEDLATEDSQILSKRELVKEEYEISVWSYKELISKQTSHQS